MKPVRLISFLILPAIVLTAASCLSESVPANLPGAELPAPRPGSGEQIVHHKAFSLSFNHEARIPNWVAWELTPERCEGPYGRNDANYDWDPRIKNCPGRSDYQFSKYGYSRGHMCPAMDNHGDLQALTECFYMSNMCPQTEALNEGAWNSLEQRCHDAGSEEQARLMVAHAGDQVDRPLVLLPQGVHEAAPGPVGGEVSEIGRGITAPYRFFKALLRYGTLEDGTPDNSSVAYIFTQDNARSVVSVNELEALTGYDLFPGLPDDVEEAIENQRRDWR